MPTFLRQSLSDGEPASFLLSCHPSNVGDDVLEVTIEVKGTCVIAWSNLELTH